MIAPVSSASLSTPALAGTSGVRFSQHALKRLEADQAGLRAGDLERLSQGMDKAATKGARESLFLLDDRAFIVNVQDRTVITSINQARLRENVFTHIDSAVII